MSSNSTTFDSTLPAQTSFYVGVNLSDILYGVYLCLYFKTMHIFLARRRAPRKSDTFYAVFSSVMLLLITMYVAMGGLLGQKAWLLHDLQTRPYIMVMVVMYIALQQMTDCLMMYRCQLVWNSLRVITIPFILWLATLVLGILVLWALYTSGGDYTSGNSARLGLAYNAIAVFLHATSTIMICYRLIRHAKTMKKTFGGEYAAPYFIVVMLLVESVLPYTLAGIAFLVSFRALPAQTTLGHVYVAMMCLAPQMLILRVAEGNAWDKDSMKPPLSVIRFNSSGCGDTSGSSGLDLKSVTAT